MTVCHREFEMTVCHGEFEMTMCHQNFEKSWNQWIRMILKSAHQISSLYLEKQKSWGKCALCGSLWVHCAPRVGSLECPFVLCAPCAPPFVQPQPTVLTTVSPRPFWNYLGYWSSKLKMSLGYWSSKRKRYWSSKWKMRLGYWSSAFFGPFCKVHWFFQRAGREGSDQNFFLPRVPKFKSVQTGWLHHLSFYTPFTQVQEITVKDLTIVTGHPVDLLTYPY